MTRGTGPLVFYRGPLAQFVSPVAHTNKCKNCAEEMENQTIFSAKQPARALSCIVKVGDFMREEYDIKNLNPRKNPYAKKLKRQITINIDVDTIDYFKSQSESNGIPYQTLINLYFADCVKEKKQLQTTWR